MQHKKVIEQPQFLAATSELDTVVVNKDCSEISTIPIKGDSLQNYNTTELSMQTNEYRNSDRISIRLSFKNFRYIDSLLQ